MPSHVGCGNLTHMSPFALTFRWTFGLSILAHAVAIGSLWGTVGKHGAPHPLRNGTDAWLGTTVSVVEASLQPSVPASPENSPGGETAAASSRESGRPNRAEVAPRDPHKVHESAAAHRDVEAVGAKNCEPKPNGDVAASVPASSASAGSTGASVDLKQAMLNSLNQPASEGGMFGAAGVDLRERRLPKALTRALPVAIGAEPQWWTHRLGALGTIRFQVVLDENGKLSDVSIADESKHAFQARVVRRVVKLLALGTFALPASTTGGAELDFELRMVVEQQSPDPNFTADPGDVVEKGFEAPSPGKPGQAIIRDAPGHVVRAFLKLVPPKNGKNIGGEPTTDAP